MGGGPLNGVEALESRLFLKHIAIDLDFGRLGEAPAGGSLLVATVPGSKILNVGTTRATRRPFTVA